VQTTLLGLALAAIVALVTALVGPLMIDWAAWRSTFETEAGRVIGMPVRIAGEIDARLLPVPSLTLRRIEAGTPGFGPTFRARTLEVELKLGSLVRGEWRADALRLDAPEAEIGLDRAGALVLPSLSMSFEPDQLAIDRLTVSGGRFTLTDAASGGRLVVERASFRGEARSLIGPFKGDGVLVAAGNEYAYRASGNRRGDDGGMKLRLNLDAVDRPLSIEADATLWMGEAKPRYEGSVVLSRPAGQVLPSGKTVANVPWRASGRVRGTSETALIEQVEIQYGPDDQAMKLNGSAQLRFGARPSLDGVLSSRQIDADRWLAPDGVRLPPAALVAAMTEAVSAAPPPLPVTLGVGIDNLSFGGAMLQAVRGDLRVENGFWNLDSLEFRAPGLTQVRASGEVSTADGAEFNGPVAVESADPRALIAWLEGRADATRAAAGSMSLRGDVTLGRTRLAIDRLKAEFDRRALDGRLSYAFAGANRPARLEADLRAAEFDLDAALAFAGNAFAGAAFERPGEVALALDFGKASYAGVEARGAKAQLTFDAGGLAIERMSIADVNGAKVEASGRIDDLSTRPRGSITLAVEAQRLDGAARLAGRLSPQASQAVQQLASRAAATRLVAKLDMGAAAAGSSAVTDARLSVDGAIGAVKIAVKAAGHGDAAMPRQATISLDGRLESDDGGALAALIGIDRHAGVDGRPARVTLRTGGKVDSELTVDAAFAGAGLDATAAGKLAWTDRGPKGTLDAAVAAADLKALRRQGGAPVAINVAGRLAIDGTKVELTGLKGAVAGSTLDGRLTLAFGRPLAVDGRIDADRVDLPALLGLALGLPAPANNRATGWMPEPFAVAPPVEVVGQLAFSAKSANLTSALTAEDSRGRLVLEPGSAHLEGLEGRLAQGRLKGDARMHLAPGGATLQADVTLTDGDLSRLMSTPGRPNGRFTLQLQAAGSGRSPAALVGALRGGGTLTLDALQVPGLDPNAIPTSVRAADQGVSIDTIRIGDVVGAALDRGALSVPFIGGGFTIADGRASFGEVTAKAQEKAQDTSFSASGNFDLSTATLDLRLVLAGAAPSDGPSDMRPRIDIAVKGPLEAPRRQVDVSALVGFLTLRTVEREAKRLEAAEREAKRLQEIAREAKRRDEMEAARRAREQQAREQQIREQQAREQQAREQQLREQQAREQQAREQQARDQQAREPGTGSVATSPPRGNPSTSGGPTSGPAGAAPALPPPIDILPIPTDRGGRRASPAVPPAGAPTGSPETR
jgi:large subunit ribosomal protein L24